MGGLEDRGEKGRSLSVSALDSRLSPTHVTCVQCQQKPLVELFQNLFCGVAGFGLDDSGSPKGA